MQYVALKSALQKISSAIVHHKVSISRCYKHIKALDKNVKAATLLNTNIISYNR